MTSAPASGGLQACWFDGGSSRGRPVTVIVSRGPSGPTLTIEAPGDAARRVAGRDVAWPARWSARGGPPRLTVGLNGLGILEVAHPEAWQLACDAAGVRQDLATRMQTRWPTLIVAMVVMIAVVAAVHRFGIPWAGALLTRHVPLEWELAASRPFLDGRWLEPSRLPAERAAALHRAFDGLLAHIGQVEPAQPGYAPRFEMHLRRGAGANAFALPGGAIVLTDELVERAAALGLPDDALVGVLAHEIGHVMFRHGTRMIVEQGLVTAVVALSLGDITSLTTLATSAIAGLSYRRAHEAEADCFALGMLARAGRPTRPMADLLADLAARDGDEANTWLSSHPPTGKRMAMLLGGDPSRCVDGG